MDVSSERSECPRCGALVDVREDGTLKAHAERGGFAFCNGRAHPEQSGSVEPTEREMLALGWLSAELAGRAEASGTATPQEWLPEPPEFVELWRRALAETAGTRS